ncbi:hypothetical protein HD806DRAFT_510277 [Xylariaceae sp. AK1471]|nr:hypothetical protein HD806DRAFT_510277 [Xylariaceae sp. AK1471]
MFSSWKLNTDGNPSERPQVFDPVTAKTRGPQACDHCRAKKVKCTRDKDGCYRCKSLSRVCRYTPGSTKQGHANEKATSSEVTAPQTTSPPYEPPAGTGIGGGTTPLQQLPGLPKSPLETLMPWDTINCSNLEPCFDSHASCLLWDGVNQNLNDSDGASRGTGNSPQSIDILDAVNSNFINNSPSEIFHPNRKLNSGMLLAPLDDPENDALYGFNTPTATPSPSLQTQIQPQDQARQFGLSEHANQSGSTEGNFESRTLDLSLSKRLPSSCACLNRMALLMDEVELLGDVDTDNLDSALATHKDALRHGRHMTVCSLCTVRTEHMIMLTFLTDKMASLCRHISNKISRLPSPSSSSTGLTNGTLLSNEDRGLVLGSYAIDSPEEYQALLRVLLRLHLRELFLFIERLKQVAQQLKSETMTRRLTGTSLSLEVLTSLRFER